MAVCLRRIASPVVSWLVLVALSSAEVRAQVPPDVPGVQGSEETSVNAAVSEAVDEARAQVNAGRAQADEELMRSALNVTRVRLLCDTPSCEARRDALERLAQLDTASLSASRVERAVERLFKTGLFESVELARTPTPSGAIELDIELTSAVRIRRITFEGLSPPPFRADFSRLLLYRQGQPFRGMLADEPEVVWHHNDEVLVAFDARGELRVEPALAADLTRVRREEERVRAQLESFEELLRREGYFSAEVTLRARRAPLDPFLIDLMVSVSKGPEQRICELGIRGLRAMSYNEARGLLLADRPIWTRYLTFVSPIYTERMLRVGQEALVREYRERGYYQARVLDKRVNASGGECVQVLVNVSEGPRWLTRFEGNKIFGSEELREALIFLETGYVDRKAIDDAERRLEQLYATRGYPFARLECEESRRDRMDRTITCFVEEGRRREIRAIRLITEACASRQLADPGAECAPRAAASREGLSDEALLGAIGTRPFGLFETGGFLQIEELMADLNTIDARYHDRGYHWAMVSRFEVIPVDSAGIQINLILDEGPRAEIERVVVDVDGSGRARPPLHQLYALFGVKRDDPLSSLRVRADNSRLTQHYAAMGYPMVDVTSRCIAASSGERECDPPRLPAECVVRDTRALEEQRCVWSSEADGLRGRCQRVAEAPQCRFQVDPDDVKITIAHRITPGPLVTVADVWTSGNLRTRDELLRSEVKLEAEDLLDVKRLLEGQANMRSLSIFDSVSVEAVGLDEQAFAQETAEALLMVSIEEGEYRSLNLSSGIQGRDLLDNARRRLLLTGDAELVNRNVFGLAQRFQPRLLGAVDLLQLTGTSYNVGAGELSVGEAPQLVDFMFGSELIYTNPRFLRSTLDLERLLLTVAPYALVDLLGATNYTLQREEVGTRAEARKELTRLLARFFITLGIQGKVIATRALDSNTFTEDGRRLFSPRRVVGKLYLDTTLDRRDSPLNPREGFFLQFSPQLVSGDALGADAGEALRDAFVKLTVGASAYKSFAGGALTFGQSVRFGQILPIFGRRRPIPQEERYVLGGVSSLRGFPESGVVAQVSSYRDLLRGGELVLNTNSELRYPLIPRFDIFGATFLDVGVLADCFDDQNSGVPIPCYQDAFPEGGRLSNVRSAAGFGVRYLVGEQIPLLIDYAMLLDRRPGERFGTLHFNVGYTF